MEIQLFKDIIGSFHHWHQYRQCFTAVILILSPREYFRYKWKHFVSNVSLCQQINIWKMVPGDCYSSKFYGFITVLVLSRHMFCEMEHKPCECGT